MAQAPPSSSYVTIHRPVDTDSPYYVDQNAPYGTPWTAAAQQARIVTFFQQKGGVGKTTCSYATAYGLARAGNKVLYVDADNQCNGLQAALSKHVFHHYKGDWTHFFGSTQFHDTLLTTLQ